MLDAGTIRANEWPGPLATAQESVLWSMYNFALGAPPWIPAYRASCLVRLALLHTFPSCNGHAANILRKLHLL